MPVEYMVTIELTDNIDHDFVAIVERVLNHTLRLYRPDGVYVVLIDNWFDHKWLEFNSSKNDNDLSGWRNKLELPPFEPSRVLSQSYFHASTSALLLYEASTAKPLHILSSRRSVGEISSSGVFLWYSYVGEHSDRGSLMVYLSEDGRGSAWYASFTKNPDWHVGKMKGISKREFTELMTVPNTMDGV
jgi:hypothetical protein